MEPALDTVTLSLEQVHDLARRALLANGCNDANATAVADNIRAAERDGAKSHGLFRVPGYVRSLANGKINGVAEPRVEKLAPCLIKVHGDGGVAPLAQALGRQPLIDATRAQGMAALAITRTHHYAALWPETEVLAEAGLVAMAFVNAPPYVAPAGGTKPFFGTNPMAFAWPRPGGGAMVWDQASAATARGELQIMKRDGHRAPDGAGIDSDGNPTNDPAAILDGAQLPFGGYKGGAIALMVDLMCGPLLGEVASWEAGEADNKDGGPATGGELILAFDPSKFGGDDAVVRSERLFERMLRIEGVRLPGARRVAARQKTPTEGAVIPKSLHDTVLSLL